MNVNAAAPLSNLPPPTPSRQVRSFDVSAADVMVLAYSDGSLDTAQLPFAAPRRIGKLQTAYEKVRWSPAAPYRLACALADGVVVTWTPVAAAAGGLEEYSPQMLRGHALEVKDVSWSPDGTRLASVSLDSTIRIWDPANAAQPVVMSKPLDGWGQVVAWDPVPSSRFVAVVVNEDLAVLRASDLSLVAKRESKAVALAWSADGRFLCVGQKNGGCQISEREQLGQVRVQLSGHSGPALGVGFAPVVYPHSVLATAATDGVLCLWSTDDEQKPFASETLPAKPVEIRFARSGSLVYVLLEDGLVMQSEARPPRGTALGADEFSRLLQSQYGDSAASAFAPSPAVLLLEKQPLPASPAKARLVAAKASKKPAAGASGSSGANAAPSADAKQVETVAADGRRRIQPVNAANAAAAAMQSEAPSVSAPAPAATATADCGTCKYCLDKPRLGGPNVLRQPCVNKQKIPDAPAVVPAAAASSAAAGPAAAKRPRTVVEMPVDAADEDDAALSEWDLSDLEPEWEADEQVFPLLPLQPFAFIPNQQSSLSLGHGLPSVKFERPSKDSPCVVTRMAVQAQAEGARGWTHPLSGRPVACRAAASGALVVVTDAPDVFVFHLETGVLMRPVLRVGGLVAGVCAAASGSGPLRLAVATRDARLWIPGQLAGVPIDPVLAAIKPGDEPLEAGEEFMVFSPNGALVVSVCAPGTLAAHAYVEKTGWCCVADPTRFVGSEFGDLTPLRAASEAGAGADGGFLWRVTSRLLAQSLDRSSLGQAVHALAAAPTSLATTLAHVEHMVKAAQLLGCSEELGVWLGVLAERLVADPSLKPQALALCQDLASAAGGDKALAGVVLPRLAKSKAYAGLVEEVQDRFLAR